MRIWENSRNKFESKRCEKYIFSAIEVSKLNMQDKKTNYVIAYFNQDLLHLTTGRLKWEFNSWSATPEAQIDE